MTALLAGCVVLMLGAHHRAEAAAINLSWSDCGTAGASDKTFACNSNSGSAVLVGSVVAPSGIGAMVAVAATLDFWSSPDSVGTPISDWWQLGTGGCRSGSLFANFDFTTGPSTCADPWSGQAVGGLYYGAGVPLPNHVTLRLGGGVIAADSVALTADTEYYAFKIIINYKKTTGAGSCSGCSSRMSIALSSIALSEPAPVPDYVITQPGSNTVVTWQGGAGLAPNHNAPRTVSYGQIRSLYH